MNPINALKNEKGMATIEIIPLLLIFVFMLSYTLGAFGVIHTGILHSIAARNYAFETFKGRANLVYFRDTPADQFRHFKENGTRIHAIQTEAGVQTNATFRGTERTIRVGFPNEIEGRTKSIHDRILEQGEVAPGRRNQNLAVNPVWVKVQYGICINARCGD